MKGTVNSKDSDGNKLLEGVLKEGMGSVSVGMVREEVMVVRGEGKRGL